TAQTMDDMVYQCSNQNSIYVLNAGYNPSYGDFGATTTMMLTGRDEEREMNGRRTTWTTTRNSIGASRSSAACSLQHKFKSFGSQPGNSSALAAQAAAVATATATTIVATATAAASTASAPATATATATTPATAAATTNNYVNPVATSMSTAMCSPATAALQKLFNCSVGGGGGGVACQNVSHRNQQQSHNHSSNNNSNNNNCPVGSHNNGCLSATAAHKGVAGAGVAAAAAVGVAATSGGAGLAAGALPLLGAVANRKKCTNVKSTLIAKKTKFLKFLEEEKWRSSAQLSAQAEAEAEACGPTTSTASAMVAASSLAAQSAGKNNSSSNNNNHSQEQNKLNNWSMHNDNNNKLANYTQQQQELKLEQGKQATRSSYELYQEAADILGLSCSLCDNCRCLDCQSGYFDCADDDDESYSEQSLMDDEYDEYDFSYGDEQTLHSTGVHQAGPNQRLMVQEEREQEREPESEQTSALELCYAVDCQQECCRAAASGGQRAALESKSEHRLAIDFDLINATSCQVLQNCATFNGLSLLDAEQQLEPFT
ncbi:hypothetical protein KR222_007827, partial [Zaprionus bogoriensis]